MVIYYSNIFQTRYPKKMAFPNQVEIQEPTEMLLANGQKEADFRLRKELSNSIMKDRLATWSQKNLSKARFFKVLAIIVNLPSLANFDQTVYNPEVFRAISTASG